LTYSDIPFEVWRKHAKDKERRDELLYVTISEGKDGWLQRYRGETGIGEITKRLTARKEGKGVRRRERGRWSWCEVEVKSDSGDTMNHDNGVA